MFSSYGFQSKTPLSSSFPSGAVSTPRDEFPSRHEADALAERPCEITSPNVRQIHIIHLITDGTISI